MTKGTDLYHLQALDSERDAKERRLAEVEAALGESEALTQARQASEDVQARVQKKGVHQRDLELEIQGVADKTKGSEQRLYSGTVKNPKELSDLQSEIESLRRRRQKLEDDLLEVMIERESLEEALEQAQAHLAQAQDEWSTQQADLLAEREELQARMAAIEEERAGVLPAIDAVDLATYQNLRRRKGGLAVAEVSGGVCGGCGVQISSSLEWELREGGPVQCGNCERIVVQL